MGAELYDTEGELLKPVLRAYLCQGTEYAARVNAIVHPRVAEAYVDFVRAWHLFLPSRRVPSKHYSLPSRLTAKSRYTSSSRYPWGRLRLWSALCSLSRVFVHWWKSRTSSCIYGHAAFAYYAARPYFCYESPSVGSPPNA